MPALCWAHSAGAAAGLAWIPGRQAASSPRNTRTRGTVALAPFHSQSSLSPRPHAAALGVFWHGLTGALAAKGCWLCPLRGHPCATGARGSHL